MPKATNTKAAETNQWAFEHPLISRSGDTTNVSCALGFLTTSLRATEPGEGLVLSYDDCCGLAFLLDTCAAALDAMNSASIRKGGAE